MGCPSCTACFTNPGRGVLGLPREGATPVVSGTPAVGTSETPSARTSALGSGSRPPFAFPSSQSTWVASRHSPETARILCLPGRRLLPRLCPLEWHHLGCKPVAVLPLPHAQPAAGAAQARSPATSPPSRPSSASAGSASSPAWAGP